MTDATQLGVEREDSAAWTEEFEQVVRAKLELDPGTPLAPEYSFMDLGADSLQMMYLFSELETRFSITFAEDATEEMLASFGSLWAVVERLVEGGRDQ